jgi:hypothetical protein
MNYPLTPAYRHHVVRHSCCRAASSRRGNNRCLSWSRSRSRGGTYTSLAGSRLICARRTSWSRTQHYPSDASAARARGGTY